MDVGAEVAQAGAHHPVVRAAHKLIQYQERDARREVEQLTDPHPPGDLPLFFQDSQDGQESETWLWFSG